MMIRTAISINEVKKRAKISCVWSLKQQQQKEKNVYRIWMIFDRKVLSCKMKYNGHLYAYDTMHVWIVSIWS